MEEADLTLLQACGITDLEQLASACAASRQALGRSAVRWSPRCLMVVIRLAVHGKGWPAPAVADALLAVARDPETRSPARVAEAGPWWDATVVGADLRFDARELAHLEWRLTECGGLRPVVQAQARRELALAGLPVTRATVTRLACQILDRHDNHRAPGTRSDGAAEGTGTNGPQPPRAVPVEASTTTTTTAPAVSSLEGRAR